MSVQPITTDVATLSAKPAITAVSSALPEKNTPRAVDDSSAKAPQATVGDAKAAKNAAAKKPVPDAGTASDKQPVRTMKMVVEEYNRQGKLRVKFMDSHNRVVYQIPSVMAAKIEDQMANSKTSINTKG